MHRNAALNGCVYDLHGHHNRVTAYADSGSASCAWAEHVGARTEELLGFLHQIPFANRHSNMTKSGTISNRLSDFTTKSRVGHVHAEEGIIWRLPQSQKPGT